MGFLAPVIAVGLKAPAIGVIAIHRLRLVLVQLTQIPYHLSPWVLLVVRQLTISTHLRCHWPEAPQSILQVVARRLGGGCSVIISWFEPGYSLLSPFMGLPVSLCSLLTLINSLLLLCLGCLVVGPAVTSDLEPK